MEKAETKIHKHKNRNPFAVFAFLSRKRLKNHKDTNEKRYKRSVEKRNHIQKLRMRCESLMLQNLQMTSRC